MADCSCILCNESAEGLKNKRIKLTHKGSRGIRKASKERGESVDAKEGDYVHEKCRKDYCLKQNIDRAKRQSLSATPVIPRPLVRAVESTFRFDRNCFFCGTEVNFEYNRKKSQDAFRVTTLETKDSVLKVCEERGDSWAEVVKARLLHVHDLPAADAIYHQPCSVNFRTKKQIPSIYASTITPPFKKERPGRPEDGDRTEAFERVAAWFVENDDEQVTVGGLVTKMEEFLDEHTSAYSAKYMKTKLKEYFGDRIIIAEINGKADVVTFRTTASTILQEYHKQRKDGLDTESEKMSIIETAAKLIKCHIKSIKCDRDWYPVIREDIQESLRFLPDSLVKLLDGILLSKNSKLKTATIGQAIMQGARPRVIIAPLQIGLAVQLHHHYASRFLIDTLSRHGVCSTYDEVLKFNENAALEQGTDIPSFEGQFVQYIADVDHNVRTLDGRDTFHGMGMVAAVTPATTQANRVPRRNVTQEEVAKAGKVEIKPPSDGRLEELNIVYNDVLSITVQDPTANLDVLWKTSLLLSAECPAWSGLMQAVHEGNHTGKSSVLFLPMIDMTPSDVTCVMFTLNFVSRHAKSHDILTPIITFDQPLWLKAFSIVNTEPADSEVRNVVVRLGAFHAQMSFLGAIGHLMAESGLKELLEMIYASNAVDHMLSAKAVSRAVGGHLIIDAALNALLYSSALGIPITRIQQGTCNLLSDANTREFGNHTDLKDFAKFQILNLPSSRRSNRRRSAA